MKKLLFVLLVTIAAKGYGQYVNMFSCPSVVDLFGLYEISFKLPRVYVNPYNPDTISVIAEFTDPNNNSYTVNGFYYEDYSFQKHVTGYEIATHNSTHDGWRIRFTPTVAGTWTFIIRAFDDSGSLSLPFLNVYHTFTCVSVNNAVGFISLANSRFLKRDIVDSGNRQFHSFFPIGPDVPWYSCIDYGYYTQPKGIYEYISYIDSLDGNANYMRVFINRYQYLSLYGPEYTQIENGEAKVYFDSIINQKDSAELDFIISYALQHGVCIMPCIYNCGDFNYQNSDPGDVGIWANNPFNTVLGLSNPCDFFTDIEAKRITKNLIRYIVSRWGYATNIMSWEMWNEVDNMFGSCNSYQNIEQDVLEWHEEMVDYLHDNDPFNHCVSSSIGGVTTYPYLYSVLYDYLDFVQEHHYEHINNAESRHQLLYRVFKRVLVGHTLYPDKPFFMGEFGFSQNSSYPYYEDKDPYGIDLHNTLWSSLFFTSMGSASFWWWRYLNTRWLFKRFTPLLNFVNNIRIPSDSFISQHTGSLVGHKLVFPNHLQTYYMINSSQDTIYGWSQDTAFAYQSLRWLTDSVHIEHTNWGNVRRFKNNAVYDPLGYVYTMDPAKRPAPSSNDNTISLTITNQPIGSRYLVRWFDSETGYEYNTGVVTYAFVQYDQGVNVIKFQFPSFIRDLKHHTINNRFGDAVFMLVLSNIPELNDQ